jgi:hypothetical protein
MIPLEEKQEIENLLSLHRFTDPDMQVLQRIVNKYISPTYQACNYCSAQLKHILKRLSFSYFYSIRVLIIFSLVSTPYFE